MHGVKEIQYLISAMLSFSPSKHTDLKSPITKTRGGKKKSCHGSEGVSNINHSVLCVAKYRHLVKPNMLRRKIAMADLKL